MLRTSGKPTLGTMLRLPAFMQPSAVVGMPASSKLSKFVAAVVHASVCRSKVASHVYALAGLSRVLPQRTAQKRLQNVIRHKKCRHMPPHAPSIVRCGIMRGTGMVCHQVHVRQQSHFCCHRTHMHVQWRASWFPPSTCGRAPKQGQRCDARKKTALATEMTPAPPHPRLGNI